MSKRLRWAVSQQTWDSRFSYRDSGVRPNVLSVCVSHVHAKFPLTDDTMYVETAPPGSILAGPNHVLNAFDTCPELVPLHYSLSYYIGLIALIDEIGDDPKYQNCLVNLASCRMFVSTDPLGVANRRHRLYTALETDPELMTHCLAPQNLQELFLLPRPMKIDGMLEQYCIAHYLTDLINFCNCAIDLGFFEPSELKEALQKKSMIIGGGSVGIIPFSVFRDLTNKSRKLAVAFHEKHEVFDATDPYQCRVATFCLERIWDILLTKHLNDYYQNGVPDGVYGHAIAITDAVGEFASKGQISAIKKAASADAQNEVNQIWQQILTKLEPEVLKLRPFFDPDESEIETTQIQGAQQVVKIGSFTADLGDVVAALEAILVHEKLLRMVRQRDLVGIVMALDLLLMGPKVVRYVSRFKPRHYRTKNAKVARSNKPPLIHFLTGGLKQGLGSWRRRSAHLRLDEIGASRH